MRSTVNGADPGGRPAEDLSRTALWDERAFRVVDFCWERDRHPPIGIGHATLAAFILVRQGSYLSAVGHQVRVGDPNHVLFYNPRDEFRIAYANGMQARGTSFRVREFALEELLGTLGRGRSLDRPFRAPSRSAAPQEYLLARSLVAHLADTEPKDPLFVEETLTTLARVVVAGGVGEADRATRDLRTDRLRRRIPQLLSYLSDDPAREVKFAELVDLMRCSPWYLSRVFGEETGLPIYRYLRRLRIRLALDRIVGGATSLTDVALDAGFASHSNFTRAFHEEFGEAPSHVRDRGTRERIRHVMQGLCETDGARPRPPAR